MGSRCSIIVDYSVNQFIQPVSPSNFPRMILDQCQTGYFEKFYREPFENRARFLEEKFKN